MKKIPAIVLILTLILCFAACKDENPDLTTLPEETASVLPPVSDVPSTLPDVTEAVTIPSVSEDASATSAPAVSETAADASEAQTTLAPVTEPVTSAPVTEPVTGAAADTSEEGILKALSDAVNKTKGYKENVTVDHTEKFNIVEPVVKLDSAEMLGTLATRAVNFVKDLVLKPSSEVYSFSGGIATTSEGEKTQLLLPKDKAFALTPEEVASATLSEENGRRHIVVTLAPEETHSLSEIPTAHANSIGYLDLAGSFKIIQIDEISIKYPGSVIDAYVRSDGYVESVTYTINLEAFSKAHGMGISGSATFSGAQIESWKINW